MSLHCHPACIVLFFYLYFLRFYLSNLYTPFRARTYNPSIKSCTVHRLSQPGAPPLHNFKEKSFNSYFCSSACNISVFLVTSKIFTFFLSSSWNTLSLVVFICLLIFVVILLSVLWTSRICGLMYFVIYGKSPVIIYLDIYSLFFYFCSPPEIPFVYVLVWFVPSYGQPLHCWPFILMKWTFILTQKLTCECLWQFYL